MIKILYFKNNICSVCSALLPKMKRIADNLAIPLDVIDVTENPLQAGQNLVFTVPALIVLDEDGKELRRFVRLFSEQEVRDFLLRVVPEERR